MLLWYNMFHIVWCIFNLHTLSTEGINSVSWRVRGFLTEEAGRVVGKMVIRKYAFHGRGINVLGTTRCFYVLISCYPGSEPGFSFWLSFFLHSVTNRHLVFTAHASLMHAYGRLRRRLLRHITEVVVVKRIPWFLGRWNHIQTNTQFAVDQH